jgi:hypothetical protein
MTPISPKNARSKSKIASTQPQVMWFPPPSRAEPAAIRQDRDAVAEVANVLGTSEMGSE